MSKIQLQGIKETKTFFCSLRSNIGTVRSGGSNDPPELYLGGQTSRFFEKIYFMVHAHTESTS